MKSAGKARSNGLYRHIRTSKEIIRNLLNDLRKGTETGESNQEDTRSHTSESATAACRNNGYLQGQGA